MRGWFCLCALLALACDPDAKACRSQFASAQVVVQGIKSDSIDSVKGALHALDDAVAACEKAKLGDEREQLKKARNQIVGHLEVLERRAARKKKLKPTPEQLAALVKDGDPTCPKGQGYRHAVGKTEIKCTGPQVIDMGAEDVKEYFTDRKYKVTTSESPPTLKAEFGTELYVFTYDKPNDTAGARCLTIYPVPGIGWEEITARVSGMPAEKIKPGKPVPAVRGELDVKVESAENKLVVRIGQCQ